MKWRSFLFFGDESFDEKGVKQAASKEASEGWQLIKPLLIILVIATLVGILACGGIYAIGRAIISK